jgi:hypothetical protein
MKPCLFGFDFITNQIHINSLNCGQTCNLFWKNFWRTPKLTFERADKVSNVY